MPVVSQTDAAAFVRPRWDAPLELETLRATVPPTATVKGMFFTGPLELAARTGRPVATTKRYVLFKDYPLTEHLDVLAESAAAIYPREPPREGLRRLGRAAFSVFADSLVGKTVLGIAGRDFDAALRLVTRAYKTIGPVGTGEVTETNAEGAVLRLRDIWNFPDSYHLGVFEGAMDHYERPGEILVRVHGPAEVDLKIVYRRG